MMGKDACCSVLSRLHTIGYFGKRIIVVDYILVEEFITPFIGLMKIYKREGFLICVARAIIPIAVVKTFQSKLS